MFPSSGCVFSSAVLVSLMCFPLTQFWTSGHEVSYVVSFCLPCDRDNKLIFHHHEIHPLCQSSHELHQTIYTVLSGQPVSISLIGVPILPLLSIDMFIIITRVETSQIKELCSIFSLVFPVSSTGLGELLVLFWETGQ